ncbi:MAG: aminoglycoside phosphotransferase family protein [Propionibacteriaceae bacterium]
MVPGIPDAQRDNVSAIARTFGVSEREVSVAPRQGQVNLTIFLGSELVLRLPRKREFEKRLSKEAQVIPFVLERGIPTAKLVSFDSGHLIADVAYIVLERLHGMTIDDMPSPEKGGERTYGSLSEILLTLHQVRKDSAEPILGIETAEFSCEQLLDELTSTGEIGSDQAAWLRQWFRRLETEGARSRDCVLLHGDVMPSNLILDSSGEVTGIIDWGSACWGEASRDLAGFHTSRLPRVLDAYRSAGLSRGAEAADSGRALEAGVLWYQLFFALARLGGRRSTSERRNWSAPREARLLELMRFLSSDIPDRWHFFR